MTGFLKGSATAMITPFCGEDVDFESFGEMIEYQIAGGTDALVVLGTTGEPSTMSEEERIKTLSYAIRKAAGRVKIVAGVGSNDTAKAVRFAGQAAALGADGLLAVTPYYNKCTQRGIAEYYRTICAATDLPVIAYNVPGRTGVNLLPETAEAIADIPNLAGIKDASGNMTQTLDTIRRIRGKCDLYSGEDALNLPILCAGGTAVISVVSNLVPAAVKALTVAVERRQLTAANKLADRLFPLAKACFTEVNPIPVKEGMNLLGFRAGVPRAPLTPLEEKDRELLKDALLAFGMEVKA